MDAKARAEKRLLDIVRCQGIAGEKFVDVPSADELAHGGSTAGMDDCRPTDDKSFLALASVKDQVASNFANECPFGFLGRHAARHKGELAMRSGTPGGNHPRSGVAGHDHHAAFDVGHGEATRGEGRGVRSEYVGDGFAPCSSLLATRPFHHDSAVHFLVGDFDPVAVETNFGTLVGGAVEALWERAVHVGGDQPAVLLVGWHRAVVGYLSQHVLHDGLAWRADLDRGIAWVVSRLADGDIENAKLPPAGHDRIEYFGQDQAVDNVAGDFHLLGEWEGNRFVWGGWASHKVSFRPQEGLNKPDLRGRFHIGFFASLSIGGAIRPEAKFGNGDRSRSAIRKVSEALYCQRLSQMNEARDNRERPTKNITAVGHGKAGL